MILRRETNIYDDEAIKKSIASVDKKFSATYGTCSTAAGTAAKVVALEDFTLFRGAQISVFFSYANTVASPTMNVNGTGAKAIWARGAAIAATYYWSSNSTHVFTYDGTHWVLENAESQEEVYKRLTNNGQNTGLYLENGSLYMNATYIHSGTLSANYIYGGTLKLGGSSGATGGDGSLIVYNAAGVQIGKWDKNGINVTSGTISGNLITAGKITSENGKVYFDLTNNMLVCSQMVGDNTSINTNAKSIAQTTYRFLQIYPTGYPSYGLAFEPNRVSNGISYISSPNGLQLYSGGPLSSEAGDYIKPYIRIQKDNGTADIDIYSSVYQSGYLNYLRFFKTGAVTLSAAGTIRLSNLTVQGTKSRVVNTSDYGDRLLYCYETSSPMFGDIGEGTIAEDGKCYIWIDNVFAETVTLNQYQAFLQKYGNGDCWVSEKKSAYFIVEGTPGLRFGWEIKAKQSDFDQRRLEKKTDDYIKDNTTNYAEELVKHIQYIHDEREVA